VSNPYLVGLTGLNPTPKKFVRLKKTGGGGAFGEDSGINEGNSSFQPHNNKFNAPRTEHYERP